MDKMDKWLQNCVRLCILTMVSHMYIYIAKQEKFKTGKLLVVHSKQNYMIAVMLTPNAK